MASDNLRQIGKYVRETREAANHALNRYSKNLPVVERARDIFDVDIPFEMFFSTKENEKIVLLDLDFNKPPPLRGCKQGCTTSACESFTRSSGNHSLTVEYPYISGSVNVFINGVVLDNSQYWEESPEAGAVFVQGASRDTNTITICYIWENC